MWQKWLKSHACFCNLLWLLRKIFKSIFNHVLSAIFAICSQILHLNRKIICFSLVSLLCGWKCQEVVSQQHVYIHFPFLRQITSKLNYARRGMLLRCQNDLFVPVMMSNTWQNHQIFTPNKKIKYILLNYELFFVSLPTNKRKLSWQN